MLEYLGMGKGPDLPALFCTDEHGQHVTLIGFGEDYFNLVMDSEQIAEGAPIPVEKLPVSVVGWIDDWTNDLSLRETIRIDPRVLPPAAEVEQYLADGNVNGIPFEAVDRALFTKMAQIIRDRETGNE